MSSTNFTIYKSSAGSGKTYTLVKEYLVLALNDDANPPKSYRNILAITFTNKAAAEMKDRIIKALKELSLEDYAQLSKGSSILLEELKNQIALKRGGNNNLNIDDAFIRKRADHVLGAVLHNYSDFAIGTIDSFVHKIVRTFAFDLKIPMSFDLEMDADKLLTQAVDLLLAQIGTDKNLTKALVEFAESKTDDEKSWHIENDLQYFAKNLMSEDGSLHIAKLKDLSIDDFFSIKDTLQLELKKFEAFIKKCGDEALKTIKDSGIGHDQFAGGANGIPKYFSYLSTVNFKKLTPSNTIRKNIDADKWVAAKAGASEKESIESIKNNLLELFDKAWDYIQANIQEITLFKSINTTIYSLAVLNEIEKIQEEYKAQNNILHISEFNKMIAKIVLNEPIPFIYERLGEKYNNYLIDEFQDTSVLQFQNLLPLIDNSLANGHFNMLVGDGKQAIYRWRGGEVEQFAMLPEVYSHKDNPLVLEREEALKRNYNPRVLDKNYRSKREIIEFNNSIFRILSGKLNEKFQGIYDKLEQGFLPENKGGFVQVEFLEGEKNEVRELNLERTYAIIQSLLQQNFQLKDIAILIRKNADGSEVANYLSKKGIAVISSESLLLSNSVEVHFISSLLQYLSNPADQIIQAEITEYLVASGRIDYKNINQALVEERVNSSFDFGKLLKKVCPEFNPFLLSKMALYELNEELVRLFKLNKNPDAYIQFYLDEVLNYSIKQNNNLKDFITFWEEKKTKASLIVPQGLDAVTIMTIHRAKGLEFPVVVLPFSQGRVETGKKHLWVDLENEKIPALGSALLSTSDSLLDTAYADVYTDEKNKSLLDSLNVLYVALTRPEERLYILTGKPSKTPANMGNLSDMFAYYFQAVGTWKEGETVYSIGEEIPRVPVNLGETSSQNKTFQLSNFYSNQWRENIKMRAAAPSIWNLESLENKKEYGVMVHTAMAKIKSGKDIDMAVNAMFSEGLINTDEQEVLKSTIIKMVSHEKLKAHFEEGLSVKNEAEIVSQMGELFRPDRVVLRNLDGVLSATLIDYKTGGEKPEHKKQILQYANLLNQMGYTVTEKLLVYIEDDKVVEC